MADTTTPTQPKANPDERFLMRTNAGPHPTGAVVTRADIEAAQANVDDWRRLGAIEPTDRPLTGFTDYQQAMTDSLLKVRIEEAVKEESARKFNGGPVPQYRQQQIAAKMTEENLKRIGERHAQQQRDINAAGTVPPAFERPEIRAAQEENLRATAAAAFPPPMPSAAEAGAPATQVQRIPPQGVQNPPAAQVPPKK